MNTVKNNIEYQIKKQIREREITPSRDLWSEIEVQSSQNKSKSTINWFLVAACLMLTFGLGTILFFYDGNTDKPEPEIVKTTENPVMKKNTEKIVAKSPELQQEQNDEKSIAIEKSSYQKPEITNSQVVAEKKEIIPSIKEKTPEIMPDILQIQQEKIIAKSDSSKIPVKRKKYVDPSTLLFSVEHKDVIEKTKESNVATIDLNGK